MRMISAFTIKLSESERHLLTRRATRFRSEVRDLMRARIVLAASRGHSNKWIARDLSVSVDTVRKWRRRFCIGRVDGLRDLNRSGRPRQFTAVAVAEGKVLACALPAEMGVPLARSRAAPRYAYLISGSQDDAADLVQDALVKTFGRLRNGFTVRSAEAYVRRAILNTYLDDGRRTTR